MRFKVNASFVTIQRHGERCYGDEASTSTVTPRLQLLLTTQSQFQEKIRLFQSVIL